MKTICMIPARLGSQRLKQKNLQLLKGLPLISHAIRKAKKCVYFNEIWVNSESDEIGRIASEENVFFHKRPVVLANNTATSEDFVYEFLNIHKCDYVVQLHSIAPLISTEEINGFVNFLTKNKPDVLLSGVNEQIECMIENKPINFSFNTKTNSQELKPVQRVTWSITAWKRNIFLTAKENGNCATYNGDVSFYPLKREAGIIIKTIEDLKLAEHILNS